MITVHKYVLSPRKLSIETHKDALVRAVHEQRGNICIWLEVDTDKPRVTRVYEIYGTGHEIPTPEEDRAFCGTVFMESGALVFHVYERA